MANREENSHSKPNVDPNSHFYTTHRQVEERHYGVSYLLPGQIEGRSIQLLTDTECTTNLLSKAVYNRLPDQTKKTIEERQSRGVLADVTQLPFYDIIYLPM